MARGTVELALAADRAGGGPLTSQLAGQLREALTDGRLATGERLPSTRGLADLLGVSRTVVTPSRSASALVEGSRSPVARRPSTSASRSCPAT